ncbi:hypothetical protein QYE76_011004 [Lolium multiflorum]|uniref:Uncharacterized protein n=1 Tax=Lolium multiflorum TaxID=4521 RepID=A0AAD8X4W3_LOLMU|nr:hypothetical protein QYE76_011004 [Lolium multiflorum]
MANNEEAGGSGSKPFWMLTDEMEVMESQPRRDDGEDDGTDPEYRADDAAEDDTTDGAAEDDTTDGAAEDDTGAPKKLRRERRPNVLSTVKQAFTKVNASGHPTAPPDLVKGYSAQLGCILRSTVSINTENLRHPDRANLRTLLFKKLHERYEFPVDCSEKRLMRNKVHNAALTKMSTALASWRNRVKKMINSGASYDKIKESNPSITEQDYADFKIKCESESTSDSSQWGKDMRKLNLGTHKLGPGGFRVAQPKWDAADEERVKNGLEPLFSQYKNKQTRNFLLARYRIDPKTKELTTTPEVKEFEALLAKEVAAESEKEASSGAGSTSSSQCAPWDNTLNRALNAHKQRDPLSKPTSAGRVVGEGCSMKWSEYYKSGKREKKVTIDEKEVAHLKAQVAQIPTLVEEQVRQQVQHIVETQQRTQRQQVEDQVGTTLSSIIPTLVAGLDEWYRGGKKGPPPVPSFTGSNSHNVEPSVSPQAATMVSPAAPTLVAPAAPTLVAPAAPTLVSPAAPMLVSPAAPLLQLNAPVAADNTPPGTAPTSGHSISCTPAAGGASTLAELDAITSSAVDVPCTLLQFVNGELIDVAKAKIVQPSNRQLHGRPMQPDVYRIQLVRVLSGYDDVLPPFQPHGADEDEVLTLQHCFNWSMVWPKSQIRLGARGTTPQTTPPALPAPSHGKTTPTVPPSADEDMQMAQDEDMQMAQDPNDGPDEDSTFANLDCNFDFGMDYDLSSQPSQAAAEGKTYCNKRRLFSSQETPEAADFTETQPIAGVRSVISPNTLKKACEEENAVPVNTKPKGRKRKKKDDKSASQPAPIRAQDGPPVPKNIESRVHVSGERMLIKRLYDAAPGPMRSLVDGIQFMEERRIREKDHGYPVYIAKVPSGHGFVDSDFAAKIFLRYDDIFAMLNSYPLHYTFIRLYSLSKAMRIIRDNTPGIAIADPFYMCAVHLATAGDRAVASEYLKGFFLANQKKYNLLLPVFPEDNTCTLISVTPRHSMATYLDADGKSSTDYTNVKAVLDDALNGYVRAKGHMERPNVRYGKHVFKHQTKFPCIKKPPSSTKDAYYALYHMNKFIRDQQQLTLPEHLRDWANKLARVPDDGIKQDFFRIQTEFCEIIHQDVIRSAGEFYAGYQPSNSDIDTMLQMQGDDYRSWMCLKKGGDMTWYVVYKGKVPGVYNDWEECRRQCEALDKVPISSPSNALSMTLVSRQLAQDLLQKGKGAMARIHSMIFPKISQDKTLGQMIDAFAVNTREVIEVYPVPSFVDDSSSALPESDRLQRMRDRVTQMEKDMHNTYALAAIVNKKNELAADTERYALTELHKATESLNFIALNKAEENKRIQERVHALTQLSSADEVFWREQAKASTVAKFQDRVQQVHRFFDKVYKALRVIWKTMFPLNAVPPTLLTLMLEFSNARKIRDLVHAQVFAGAEFTLSLVLARYPSANLLSIAKATGDLELLYPKVMLPANMIVDRLEQDSKTPEEKETPQE